MSRRRLATGALLAGVGCFLVGAVAVFVRAVGLVDVPQATVTALAVLGLVLVAAGVSMQRSQGSRG